MADWREQFRRMVRWKARLWIDPIAHGANAVDTFYAYATACYHLIDWLENDPRQPIRRGEAEAFVMRTPILAFCGEICNGSKHARLQEKEVRVKSETTTQAIHLGEDVKDFVFEKTRLFVEWSGEYIDIEEFANRCNIEWARFLMSRGVISDISDLTT
jgi:hypothetical protein